VGAANEERPEQVRRPTNRRTAGVWGAVIAGLGVGWFLLSHVVMGTAISDALGEALGVVLALLVVASVIGAIVSGRGNSG
jgi:hypothetical protein